MTRQVVITGALGGVGRACVATFREAGWAVAGTDRRPHAAEVGTEAFAQIDLTDPGAGAAFGAFLETLGRVDALVNNAAQMLTRSLVETTDAEWAEIMTTNVTAAFIATRLAYPYLRETRGSVVNVSSVHALATSRGVAAYATSKGGLTALTRAAALELASDGIRVNAVLPGAVDTPMLHAATNARFGGPDDGPDPLETLASRTPLGRIGRPEEIASVVLFLADGERSSFVTGQAIVADGGVLARLASE